MTISKKLPPKNNCEIYENVNKVNMPYYENQILEHLKKQGTDEYYGKHSLKGPHVDISNGLIANGSLSISSSKFAGNGIIYANDELSYSVSSLSNLSKGKLVLCSANGDINIHASNTDINGIIYAPNGKVTITGANVTINGRIIADEFNFRGSNLTINSADNDLDILDFLFLPSVEIKAEGELKENRKVVLDISHLDKIEELAKEDIIWKISNIDDGDKLEAVEGLHYLIDDSTSDELTKNMVFKKYGKYEVELLIKSGNAEKSSELILDISEDIIPIADFTVDNTYYLRDSDHKAKIKLKDSSFSADNDKIGQRIWTVYHDLNNDGVFDDSESEIISDENKTEIIYKVNKVGNFKVELTVIEDFKNTIPSLISEDDYKRGNTDHKDSNSKEFAIGNIKPESNVDVGLAKDVDLVFTVGSADVNTINSYGDKINDIKTDLEEEGYNVKLSTVSTTSLTAQDTFAWTEYDHYNYEDRYLPTIPKHILYEGSSIKMLGYGREPLKDFLIVEDENPSQKIFEFDIQRDRTDWHSIEGGGFLFNSSVINGEIKGFYVLITQGGLKLMEIKGLPVDLFQNGRTTSLTQLRTFPLSNLYDEHHFKIIVEEDSITLWDDDKLIIDNYKLPDNNYGNGYGPITSHASHACGQQSYFTFNNITMQTITGENLSDVLANYDWASNTSRYVINLSDSTLEEFETDEEIAEVAKQILENNINFIGIGNGENNEQYSSIINSAANNGIYLDSNDINLSSSNLANYIMSSENTKDFSVDYYISKDQPVRYIDSYSDYENDPLYEQVWEYEYDPSVFAGNKEDGKVKSFTSETPITKFSETGAYSVKLKVRDNPVGDNDALDEYRLWSDESQSKKVLMVHNRPISNMDIAISVDTSDSSKCLINVKDDCFDPDYKDIKGKGIVSKEYKWKSLHDADWTNGMIPSKLDMGEIYLISLTATDQEGEVSAPCVEVVNTGNAIEIDPSTRPVIVDNIPELVGVGESFEIIIEATSSVGIDKLEVYLNEELINLSDSKYVFIPRELGEYTLRITITDKNGIQWDVEKVMTVVITDKEAPLVDIIFDKDIYYEGDSATFEVEATDNVAVDKIELIFNGEILQLDENNKVTVHNLELKTHTIIVKAWDTSGNSAQVSYNIIMEKVKDNMPPTLDIIEMPEVVEIGETIRIIVNAEDDSSEVTVYAEINGQEIPVINGILEYTPIEAGEYEILIKAEDPEGNSITKNITINVVSNTQEPEDEYVNLIVNDGKSIAYINEEVLIYVEKNPEYIISSMKLEINNQEIILDEEGKAKYIPEKVGVYNIELTYQDSDDKLVIKSFVLKVYDKNDQSRPLAEILEPSDGEMIKAITDIRGTASGDGFIYYTLSIAEVGNNLTDSDYHVFYESDKKVEGDVLGILDPTLLHNGYYNIRLSVYSSNYKGITEIVVSIEGAMKIGNYSIDFRDIDIPVNSFPLTVIRGYDSRDKNKNGDFGYGWNLSMSSIKLSESCAPGEYWEQRTASGPFGMKKFYFHEQKPHEVKIDWGNGQVDKFKMKLSPWEQNLIPIQYNISAIYEPIGATKGTLYALGETTDLIFNDNTIYDSNSLDPYNPSRYKFVKEDGTSYIINDKTGVESITDINGNVISFTKDGVTHSDGKSIVFERDNDNRIRKINGPTGKSVSYEYDAKGDLVSFIDVLGESTGFVYDDNHFLMEIIDSRGVKVARNEYDQDGRLVATIDAHGNRTEFSHDLDAKREVITDRLGNVTIYEYDESGNVTYIKDALGNTTYNSYDSNGYLASKTDALGNISEYNYDESGKLLSVTDAFGNTVTNTYDIKGQLTSIKAFDVSSLIIDYDELGNLSSTTDALGNEINYSYNNKGMVTNISDSIGDYMKFTYDSNGHVISSINGAGEVANFTYDEDGNCISKTLTRTTEKGLEDITEQYSYDLEGKVTKVIYGDGSITNIEYNSVGKMSAAIDEKGRRTEYEYDLFGNLINIKYHDNTNESFAYDVEGRNIETTDRLGRSITMTYDGLGNLLTKTYPNGAKISYSYDAKGRLIELKGINGGITKYEYDALDRNTKVTDALNNETSFIYGNDGLLTSMIDAKHNTYSYSYDKNGNRTGITMPDGTTIKTEYDARGRIIRQIDQYGYETFYKYDGADRLIEVKDALNSSYKYTYDGVGNLSVVTDAMGNKTSYEYDECGRVIKTINAKGKETKCSYDEAGNLTSYTDFAGITSTYTYDENDRLISKELSKGSDKERINYTYTIDGKLLSVTDKNGTMTYAYDLMDGLTSIKTYDGKEIRYSYDDALRMVEISTEYGKTTYDYDILDRLTRVVSHDGTATLYEYDANGNRTAVKYEGGITTTYEYDDLNRLIKEETIDKDSNIIAQYLYTLGLAGERVKVEEYDADGLDRTVEYEYDELYRLVKETITDSSGSKTTRYSYDKNSNRTLKDENGIKTSYGYNELNQLILEGSKYYAYDDNGNLVKVSLDGALLAEYSYDMEDRLVKALVVGEGKTITEEYLYDYNGTRIAKITDGRGVNYLVDTSGMLSHVLAEYDDNDNLIVYYTRGIDLISQERDGNKHYYLYDGHNSVRMLVDEEGNVSDRYTYDAFGNLIGSTETTENDYLYCGEEYNETTGLYYLRARYMNPSNGTFISMDKYQGTIHDPISLHKYLYANANPVMNSDPTGYFTLNQQMESLVMMGILMSAATLSIAIVRNVRQFLQSSFEDRFKPQPIRELLDTVGNILLDGISGLRDVADDIRDDVATVGIRIDYNFELMEMKYPWNELPTTGDYPFHPPVDKAGNPVVKKGSNRGMIDRDGNEWTMDKQGAKVGNPHWDVQHKDGTHTNVNPESSENPGDVNHGKDNFK